MGKSGVEARLVFWMRTAGLPEPVMEMRFDSKRKWRFDFAWPGRMIAVEVEGGTWVQGRHTRGKGFESDCRKYNAAALAGWRVFRFTGVMIDDGTAIATLEQVLRDGEEVNGG